MLALLDMPGATLLDIPRLLLNRDFAQTVVRHVGNPAVREFFMVEFEDLVRGRAATVAPILNKVGPWLAYPELRNIIGQPRSSFDLRDVMDSGKVLLVRIPQGALGEDASNLLGALVVARIQLAAQSRVDMPAGARRPFYLYVDEFQNFATSSFAKILTEARAFGLGLICANQYLEQLPRDLRLALSHNAGTFVQTVYSRGRYLAEVVRRVDLGGDLSPVFIVRPPSPLPPGDRARAAQVRTRSRLRYGRPLAADLPVGARRSGNGREGSLVGVWGHDLEEE